MEVCKCGGVGNGARVQWLHPAYEGEPLYGEVRGCVGHGAACAVAVQWDGIPGLQFHSLALVRRGWVKAVNRG